MTEKERMLSGQLYSAADEELRALRGKTRTLVRRYNAAEDAELPELLRGLFGAVGKNCWVEPPLRTDYGKNVHVGDDFYANYGCMFIDVLAITIGNGVMLGPGVCLCTASHPLDAGVRRRGLELGKPIRIGNDVWIGANVTVNPGVTIGDGAVIGSGSVVTRDVPGGVVAAGVPCRVLRRIGEEDRLYWEAEERRHPSRSI